MTDGSIHTPDFSTQAFRFLAIRFPAIRIPAIRIPALRTSSALLSGGLVLALSLAACERPSAVAARSAPASGSEVAYAAGSPDPGGREGRPYEAGPAPRSQDRAEAPAPLLDGRPIWTSSRRGGAEENARKAFARNGESFGAPNLDAYVRKARTFIEAPPSGAQRLTRRNGDVLMYHPGSNTFAVASRDGTPRAFFQPDDGPAYWEAQKARESQGRTASTGAARSSDG